MSPCPAPRGASVLLGFSWLGFAGLLLWASLDEVQVRALAVIGMGALIQRLRPAPDKGFAFVMVAHRQGPYLAAAVRCTVAALHQLSLCSIPVELILVLYQSDRATRWSADRLRKRSTVPTRIASLSSGGEAEAWSAGVSLSRMPWLVLGTAEDLVARNFMTAVDQAIDQHGSSPQMIYHPGRLFGFEQEQTMVLLPHQEELSQPLVSLLCRNLWPGVCVAHQSAFSTCQLPRQLGPGSSELAGVLWDWHALTLMRGFKHAVLPETCQFRRYRSEA